MKGQAYSILLLFTSGTPADLAKSVQALNDVDSSPLSIVIVGVGGGSFDGMDKLVHRNKSGNRSLRDNTLFVRYDSLKNDQRELTAAALDPIPAQLVHFFTSKDIYPNPEPEVPEIAVEPYQGDIEVPLQFSQSGQAIATGHVIIPEQPPQAETKDSNLTQKVLNFGKKAMNSRQGRRQVGRIKRRLRTEFRKITRSTIGVSL